MVTKIETGLDRLGRAWPRRFRHARVGLLVHPASVDHCLQHATTVFSRAKYTVSALFGPQHGFFGQTQDNMIEWKGFKDRRTGIPVYSLYGKQRKPTPQMLRDCDVMVIDLQDVGARYYTFIWTMALVMEACEELGKGVIVLDRPNPLSGRYIEGPVLKAGFSSFVGLHPLPIRHGMTIGEIAQYLKREYCRNVDLHIIKMNGWKRNKWFTECGIPWVMPSPNMPTLETALVYPGMCLLEGTNLSEGRGTTRPFEIFGAPFIDPPDIVTALKKYNLPGVTFRSLFFLPTFQKHANVLCGGAQMHVFQREKFKPFKTAVAVLKAVHETYPEKMLWNRPPYEYEKKLLPIDILAGTDRVRKDIEDGRSLQEMEAWWDHELSVFNKALRKPALLY